MRLPTLDLPSNQDLLRERHVKPAARKEDFLVSAAGNTCPINLSLHDSLYTPFSILQLKILP